MMKMCSSTSVVRWRGGEFQAETDSLVAEEPLEIRVAGRPISVTMRTPEHDLELAAGFLLSEGVVRRREDILRIRSCPRTNFGNAVDVVLDPEVRFAFESLTRHVFAASSCGLCGKATIDAIRTRLEPIPEPQYPQLSAVAIAAMPEAMRKAQRTFDRTGGLHAAALFDETGRLLAVREDVGRHNAVDKVLGRALMEGLMPLERHVLVVSGRASFEIMQKALAGRIPVVAAVSAPSSLAVDFARANGQTLIGFLRDERMNIYSGHERLGCQPPEEQPDESVGEPDEDRANVTRREAL
jgi:FdhD protein